MLFGPSNCSKTSSVVAGMVERPMTAAKLEVKTAAETRP